MGRTVYLNFKGAQGRETVDELSQVGSLASAKEFRKELNRLMSEYELAGMPVYSSNRPCQNWV